MAEPVVIDGIPVELSAAQQRKWDTEDEAKREEVREVILGYRAQDGPQFEPPSGQGGHVEPAPSYNDRFGESDG